MCLSHRACQHQHEHDHFLDHIKHVMKERAESGSQHCSLGKPSLKEMSCMSHEHEENFLLDQKQAWLKQHDRCCDHEDNGSCCSDDNHCDGLSGGHCNGHEDLEARHFHPCHDLECNMKSLGGDDCDAECQSCVDQCESCQLDVSFGNIVQNAECDDCEVESDNRPKCCHVQPT